MITRLLQAIVIGVITFIIFWIIFAIVATFLALPFSAYAIAALLGLLAGIIYFLSGRTFPIA